MKCQRILVATDFSPCSEAALDYASRIASESNAVLYIVHVDGVIDVSPVAAPRSDEGYLCDAPWGHEHHEVHKRLLSICPTVPNVKFEHHYLTGMPAGEILDFAEKEHVDLIVVGSHGRSGLLRLVMGSVAEAIVRSAHCPVITVKQPSSPGETDPRAISDMSLA